MSDEQFLLNKSACSLKFEDETLVIHFLPKEKEKNEENKLSRTIPVSEILSVSYVKDTGVENRKFSLRKNAKLSAVLIQTIKRCKDRRWRLIIIKLKSTSEQLCQRWISEIEDQLQQHRIYRPQSLLVFVNPCGGRRIAKDVYDKKARPIFEAANIKTHVIVTTHRNHAREFIEHEDLTSYDGIIAVGGDGMLNEVVNGLLCVTQSKKGVSIHAKKGSPRDCPKYARPELRVGVIPAGSTDCVSYVTNGINDAETAALHIVLGDSHPLDVTSLHDSDGLLKQFSMSLTGYGFYGDMLRKSENFRWMGPPRYSYVGVNTFLINKSYSGEVHYLPVECKEGPKSQSFCRSPCNVCQDGFEEVETPLFTPITPNGSFFSSVETAPASLSLDYQMSSEKSGTSDSSECLDGLCDSGSELYEHAAGRHVISSASDGGIMFHASIDDAMPRDATPESATSPTFEALLPTDNDMILNGLVPPDATPFTATPPTDGVTPQSFHATPQTDDAKSPNGDRTFLGLEDVEISVGSEDGNDRGRRFSPAVRPSSLNIINADELDNSNSSEEEGKWQVLKGEFVVVNGVPISCACERAPLGMSPASHLSDGALDLITVRACSRYEFLRYLLAHVDKADRFAFPFVEVRRVKAFQFIPSSSPSTVNSCQISESPGEVVDSEAVRISLSEMSVEYNNSGNKKHLKKSKEGTKRSKSMCDMSLSTWNSDGEVVKEANITVRVHRGLIVMFCRGVENLV